MVVVTALEVDKACTALVVFVLTNRANLGRVKFGDLAREFGLDHVELAKLRDFKASFDLVSLSAVHSLLHLQARIHAAEFLFIFL